MKFKSWMIPIVLCGIIGITFLIQRGRIINLEYELDKARIIAGNLPEDVINSSTLNHHILTEIKRHAGTDSVIVETQYVPVESEVIYITQVDTIAMGELEQAQILLAQLEQQMLTVADSVRVDSLRTAIQNLQRMVYVTEIEFDKFGFCTEPCVVGGIDSNISGIYGLGIRLFYMKRFGIGIQGTIDDGECVSLGGFLDWRIPKREAVAPFVSGDYGFNSEKFKMEIGIHLYF